MPGLQALVEGGSLLLLFALPLVFSTHLAEAVTAPKQAVFLVGASALLTGWGARAATGSLRGALSTPLATAAFLLYAWWALTGLLAGLSPGAVPGTLDAAFLAVLVLAWTATLDPGRARRWTGWVCAAALLAGLYSHLQRLTPLNLRLGGLVLGDPVPWNNPHLSQERTIATFGNPDYLAAWLVAVLPLALSWVLQLRRPAARWAGLAAWVLTALAMVLTLTRAAWVGGAVGGLVWLGVSLAGLEGPGRARILRALAGVAMVLVLLVLGWQVHSGRADVLRARVASLADFQDLSFRTRLFFWGSALRTLGDHPLAGVGPGGFPAAARMHRDLEPVETRTPPRTPENPHNQYLTVAVETGVPGLLLLGAVLFLFFAPGGRGLERAGVLGAGAAHWANQAFISSTLPSEVFWVFLIALAAAPARPSLPVPEEGAEGPVGSDRPGSLPVAVAGLVFMALMTLLAGRILASERLARRAEDARFQARAMLEARRSTGQELLRVYQQALDLQIAAARTAPTWSQADAERRVASLFEEVYLDVSGGKAEPPWKAALAAYQVALEADPGSPSTWAGLARLQALRPEHRSEALPTLARARALDPRNPSYLALQARLLHDLGRRDEALTTWDEALEIAPQAPGALVGRAETLGALGRWPEAEADLSEAIRLDPEAAKPAARIRAARNPGAASEEPQEGRRKVPGFAVPDGRP